MDTTSLYYFTELCKDLHMTKTANRLYISQQTLSNHILRLEDQLGAKLFYRKPSLSLTYAGEFVRSFADVVMKEQTNLSDILSDIEQQERGLIRFGSSTLRMNGCLPAILPAFTARYPNVELRLKDSLSANLEPLITSGELDYGLITFEKETPELLQEHLMDDQVYLCVPDALLTRFYTPEEIAGIKERSEYGATVKDFDRLPFCLFSNRLGRQIQLCFDEARVTPKAYITTDYTHISTTIGFQGLAAFFATHMNLASRASEIPEDLNIMPLLLGGDPLIVPVSLLRSRQRYLAHYSKYFLELLADYFAQIAQEPIVRLIGGQS